jgi:hypothetical protein
MQQNNNKKKKKNDDTSIDDCILFCIVAEIAGSLEGLQGYALLRGGQGEQKSWRNDYVSKEKCDTSILF